ncbi:activator-dependent family glycosyltransferase [Nocardia sp. NPDC050175]|uniref:activator-dependent family glycosyltransferase n=1 Tax=Nocardia sp. NPDC050175 TaxID=3364317 RepID=UPI0037AF8ABE
MRVLLVTVPWKTHFFNFVPLGWALQTAGHEVRVASEPELLDTITGAGLTAVAVGGGDTLAQRIRQAWRDKILPPPEDAPPMGEPRELFDVSASRERLSWPELNRLYDTLVVPRAKLNSDTMIDDLVTYCQSWRPDLVVWNAATFAGAIAATAVGAAHARVLYSVDVYTRMREDYLHVQALQPPAERVDGFRDWLTQWAGKYGCEFSEDLVNGHVTIDQMPPQFRLESDLTTLSCRYVPYNGPAVIPSWLSAPPPRPRVLMTSGLSVNEWPEFRVVPLDRVQDILHSLADLDIELVLTLPAQLRDQLRIPGNTKVVDFVPLPAVLPSCAAVIHHGGAGSFNSTLLCGVPQLLISQALDAPIKAAHLQRLRAGLSILPDEVSGPEVRRNLVQLLSDPSFAEGAERLRRAVLDLPTPNELVRELERLTAEHRAEVRG